MWDGSPERLVPHDMELEEAKRKVLELNPKAFLKRTVEKYYTYQVRIRTGWFSSKPLGNKHWFKDQAWRSALESLLQNTSS